jgi:hypothetical protein
MFTVKSIMFIVFTWSSVGIISLVLLGKGEKITVYTSKGSIMSSGDGATSLYRGRHADLEADDGDRAETAEVERLARIAVEDLKPLKTGRSNFQKVMQLSEAREE